MHVEIERKLPLKLFESVNEMEYTIDYGKKCDELGFTKVHLAILIGFIAIGFILI